jgi:hypothetical protein
VHGAFKSLDRVQEALLALLRLLWALENQPKSIYDFPMRLGAGHCPCDYAVKMTLLVPAHWADLIRLLFDGNDDEALSELKNALADQVTGDAFLSSFLRRDLETLNAFYQVGPARNQKLRADCGYGSTIIEKTDLDDLLVLASNLIVTLNHC